MTIRSMFKTSTISTTILLASLVVLAARGDAQAGNTMHGFHHDSPPIARIPTGPNKALPYRFCTPHLGCTGDPPHFGGH